MSKMFRVKNSVGEKVQNLISIVPPLIKNHIIRNTVVKITGIQFNDFDFINFTPMKRIIELEIENKKTYGIYNKVPNKTLFMSPFSFSEKAINSKRVHTKALMILMFLIVVFLFMFF